MKVLKYMHVCEIAIYPYGVNGVEPVIEISLFHGNERVLLVTKRKNLDVALTLLRVSSVTVEEKICCSFHGILIGTT